MEPIYLIQLRIAQKWYTENGIKATIKQKRLRSTLPLESRSSLPNQVEQ